MKEFILGLIFSALAVWFPAKVGQTTVASSSFGSIRIFKKPTDYTQKYIILISEAHGWDAAAEEVARDIASEKNVVIGIDRSQFNPRKKLSAEDLPVFVTELGKVAKSVQQIFNETKFRHSVVIILKDDVGISAQLGSRLADEIFGSVSSIQGCFDPKPILNSLSNINKKIFLYSDAHDNCGTWDIWSRSENVSLKKITNLEENSIKFSNWPIEIKNIWRQTEREPSSILESSNFSVVSPLRKLPLILVEPSEIKTDYFVVLYSGDGGWAGFTQGLAAEYKNHGIPVVGLNTLFYFWKPQSPKSAAADLSEIADYFSNQWKLKKFRLVGFSFGAEVLPAIFNQLSRQQKKSVSELVMIAPGKNVKFEFTIKDWLQNADTGRPISDDLREVKNLKLRCIYGEEDRPGVCEKLTANQTCSCSVAA